MCFYVIVETNCIDTKFQKKKNVFIKKRVIFHRRGGMYRENVSVYAFRHRTRFFRYFFLITIIIIFPKLSRRQDNAITRTRIGHALLAHSYLITKDLPPICNICHATITIKRIFEECPRYEPIRATLNLSKNIKEAPGEDQATKIINFITKCNLLNKI